MTVSHPWRARWYKTSCRSRTLSRGGRSPYRPQQPSRGPAWKYSEHRASSRTALRSKPVAATRNRFLSGHRQSQSRLRLAVAKLPRGQQAPQWRQFSESLYDPSYASYLHLGGRACVVLRCTFVVFLKLKTPMPHLKPSMMAPILYERATVTAVENHLLD